MRDLALAPTLMTRVRTVVPPRRLTGPESAILAERQATRLLREAQIAEPPVPQFIISSLPGITVARQSGWPTSGMSTSTCHGWHVVLSSDDALCRQRFTLAHEFKHILDDPVVSRLYGGSSARERRQQAERAANIFAACLLMPRAWVKRDWGRGLQTLAALSYRYAVSKEAMAIRLAELGLYHPIGSAP